MAGLDGKWAGSVRVAFPALDGPFPPSWRVQNRALGSDSPILQGTYMGESHGATPVISNSPIDALHDPHFFNLYTILNRGIIGYRSLSL